MLSTHDQKAYRKSERSSMFAKRAGRFTKALIQALNGETFTPIGSITATEVVTEDDANIDSTLSVLSNMQFVEVSTNENGEKIARLTPSGVAHFGSFFAVEG
jgi:hypothetical protein